MGRRRFALVAGLLAALAAAAFAFFAFVDSGSADDTQPLATVTRTSDRGSGGAHEQERQTGDAPRQGSGAAREAEAPAESYELRILVVARGSDAPVAGAEVRACDDDFVEKWIAEKGEEDDAFEPGPMPWGAHVVCREQEPGITDAAGLVRLFVRKSASELYVTAREAGGGREGFRQIDAELFEGEDGGVRVPTIRVELGPPRKYRIRVRDAAGRVAPGVPCAIALLDRRADRALSRQDEPDGDSVQVDTLAHYITGARGEFVIEHFGEHLAELERRHEDRAERDLPNALLVLPRIPLRDLVYVRIPLDREPRELYELRLPPTASLELRYRFADGTPVSSAIEASISFDEQPRRHGRLHVNVDVDQYARKAFGAEACARFPYIGTRVALYHSYELRPQGFTDEEYLSALGSSGALRRVTRLSRETTGFVVSLRDGAEIPQEVQFDGVLDEGEHVSLALHPDPDQRFRFYLNVQDARRRLDAAFWKPSERSRGAALSQHPAFAGRLHELPELHFRSSEASARGVCRDERGDPLADAWVYVMRATKIGGRRKLRYLHDTDVRTKADGRFELLAPPLPAETLALQARCDGYATRTLAYRPGAEHEFVLTRTARLDVRIRDMPETVPQVRVRCDRSGAVTERQSPCIRQEDGSMRTTLSNVTPGRKRVTLDAGGFYGAWTERVDLRAGGDAELVTRAPTLHQYEFDFGVDAPVFVRHLEREDAARWPKASLRFTERGARISSFDRELPLEFSREGFAATQKRWKPGRHRVAFAPVTPVELRLEGLAAGALDGLLISPVAVLPEAVSRRGPRSARDREYFEADSEGRVLLPLAFFDASYYVLLARAGHKKGRRVRLLTIPARGRKASYTVRVDALLAREIQELRAR